MKKNKRENIKKLERLTNTTQKEEKGAEWSFSEVENFIKNCVNNANSIGTYAKEIGRTIDELILLQTVIAEDLFNHPKRVTEKINNKKTIH